MDSLWQYIVQRVGSTIPMLLILIVVVFLILRVIPGDPARAMLGGRNVSEDYIQRVREEMGLSDPLHIQFFDYIWGLIRGDFGTSFRTDEPVLHELMVRVPATLELAFYGMGIAVLLGVSTGAWAAVKSDTFIDHGLRLFHIGAFAVPLFWMGLMFQIVFAVFLGWLPVGNRLEALTMATFTPITGFYTLDALIKGDFGLLLEALRHLILPALTLGIIQAGLLGRMTRANMLEIMDKDYVKTARSKGLVERIVIFKHALRNALIPILTVFGLQFAILIGGAVLTETIYAWPGVARFLITSVNARDFPSIQGAIVMIAVFITTINLIVDIIYAQLDPRVKY
ncbi:MAG: ABC transporter permease [Candidatus Acetothermia bacterium]